jgi:hypothetical protein
MATTSKSKFGQVVSAKLIENKIAGRKPESVRGLAKLMAKGDPVRAETFKRSLFKWMAPDGSKSGAKPLPGNRALVAHHLEIDASELDDEEDDPAVVMLNALRQMMRAETLAATS